jgi:hypothetical protein
MSRSSGRLLAAMLGAGLLFSAGCSSSDSDGAAGAGGSGGSTSSGGSGGGTITPGTCDPDPLKTGLPPLFNDNSVDMYDCEILKYTAKYNEPDAMIFKAIVYVESRFQYDAVGCTSNSGCCPESNWAPKECACLGSMQTGPHCGEAGGLGLLPDGHVNLETDPNASGWSTSVFNPEVNIELGIAGIAGNREQVKKQFPGCSEEQYTLMAIGNFNHYGSTKSCTEYNFDYDNAVLEAYKEYSDASGWPAHPY